MSTARHILALLKSHLEGEEQQFYSAALQMAAHEARQGHGKLAQEIRGRRDAAIEFEAALQERSRLAANLHDTVLQTVTGLGLQIRACGLKAEQLDTPSLVEPLNMAWKIAQRSQEDLRNAVWALNALPVK